MAKQTVNYTKEGYQALVDELNDRKNVQRERIVKEIEVARGFGDLSENSEYDEARNEQAKNEARIKELDELIQNAVIVDEATIDVGRVAVGSTVVVWDCDMEEEDTYTIVGSNEVNALEFRISDLSPIGKALMGHVAGETVTVETPKMTYQMEIRKVERTKKF